MAAKTNIAIMIKNPMVNTLKRAGTKLELIWMYAWMARLITNAQAR